MTSRKMHRCGLGLVLASTYLALAFDARAQAPPYFSPDPGAGVLGSGVNGVPGPPSQRKGATRPPGWPGSPDVDEAAMQTPIDAPRPVHFPGMAEPPADLSMYQQHLRPKANPGSNPVQAAAAYEPVNPPATGGGRYAPAPPNMTPPINASYPPGGAPAAAYVPQGYPPAGYPNSAQPPAQPNSNPPLVARQSSPGAPSAMQQRTADAMNIEIPAVMDIDGATVVAQVDGTAILASDLLPAVNWKIQQNIDKLNPKDIPAARQFLMQQELESAIMMQLLVNAAKRKIPEKNFADLQTRIGSEFYKEEMPNLFKQYDVATRNDLETLLRQLGTSLEREKRAWVERIVAQQWLFNQKKEEKEVTHDQLLNYYYENVAEFQFPSRAKWEQLTVNFGSKRSKYEARQKIAMAGDQILRGAPFAEVAKAVSEGTTASEGGQRDWTTRGSLASDVLNEALFSLPVGNMSPILEDKNALHIIRVIERTDAGQTPFEDAQDSIAKSLAQTDQKAQRHKYLEDLRKKAIVWTIFERNQPSALISSQPQSMRQ